MSQNRFDDLLTSINGDSIIRFTSAKELKAGGFLDSAKVSTYLMSGDEASHTKHLGMINLFKTTHNVNLPMLADFYSKASVLEVEPGQSITYDLPVSRTKVCSITTSDTSLEQDFPGIDGSVFAIELSQEFTKGDILSYDVYNGEQIMVSNDHDVEMVGENYRHYVYYSTKDKTKYFPKDKLKAGIEYIKITNVIGEYETDFSKIDLIKKANGSITCEFMLGDPRGVETMYTAKASSAKSPGLKAFSDEMRDKIMTRFEAMGGQNKEMFLIANKAPNGGYVKDSVKVGTTLEYLALMELAIMECQSLMFAKAASFRTATGTKSINEGIWHQLRRGKLIKYSKPGGITMNHIHEAVSYLFKNSQIPVNQRKVKFKVGSMAWANVMQLFREESIHQLNGIPAQMLGNDAQIGKVFSGSLDDLTLNAVQIRQVQIPGVGWVEVELDETLDYQPFADRFSSGFYGNSGLAWTSYSMVIWDATDPQYSNVESKVKGAKLVEGGSKTSNIYYVKPEGAHVVYGYEQGRMANGARTEEVQSSLKYMGRTFWATSHSSALVLDTTRFVSIELQNK